MVKKILSLAIAYALILSLLAGCGSMENIADSYATTLAAASSTSENKKDVTLTLWQDSANTYQRTLDMQAKFQQDNPHIKMNIIECPQGTAGHLSTAVASGTAPAMLNTGWPDVYSWAYQKLIMPLDDYIAKTPDWNNFDEFQREMFNLGGKHYGVPGGGYLMLWGYNKKLFAEAGISAPPTNWDELLADAKKLTVPEKQQYGIALLATQWGCWWFENFAWGAGGDLTKRNDDGTLQLTFTDPAVIKAAEFYRILRKEKVVQTDISKDLGALQTDFALGKAAMMYGASSSGIGQKGGKPEDFGFFTFPVGPSGKAYTQSGGGALVIPTTKDADVAQAAWTYIMYAYSKDEQVKYYKEMNNKGGLAATQILGRNDFKLTDCGSFNADELAAAQASKDIQRPEFYGKGAVAAYADDAVSTIFGDLNSDITKTFQAAEDKAKADVDKFNKGMPLKETH